MVSEVNRNYFEFDIVTIDATGREINRDRGNAHASVRAGFVPRHTAKVVNLFVKPVPTITDSRSLSTDKNSKPTSVT